MTELELQILDNAKEHIPALKIKIQGMKPKSRYIDFVIPSDMTFDFIKYDTKIGRFIEVKYFYDAGGREPEIRKIDLTNVVYD